MRLLPLTRARNALASTDQGVARRREMRLFPASGFNKDVVGEWQNLALDEITSGM
jgi:hypothetical protein